MRSALRALRPAILRRPAAGTLVATPVTSLPQQLEIEMARDSRLGLVLTTAALSLMASAGVAQTSLSDTDRQFIEQAAEGGHAEVSMGQSAAKSENPAVSAFGKQMIADHTKLNDQLAAVAKEKGVEPPASPDLGSQAKGAMTSVLPGKTFDSQYVSSQLDDHKETLALFQQEGAIGPGPRSESPGQEGHSRHPGAYRQARAAAKDAGAAVTAKAGAYAGRRPVAGVVGGPMVVGAGLMPDEQRVRERAHQLWERDGRPEGGELAFWHEAERQLRAEAEGMVPVTPGGEGPVDPLRNPESYAPAQDPNTRRSPDRWNCRTAPRSRARTRPRSWRRDAARLLTGEPGSARVPLGERPGRSTLEPERPARDDRPISSLPPPALHPGNGAHEVSLADRHAVVAQDVVGGRRVKIEVRQGEEHEVVLPLEGQPRGPALREMSRPPSRRSRLETTDEVERLGDARLQFRERLLGRRRIWRRPPARRAGQPLAWSVASWTWRAKVNMSGASRAAVRTSGSILRSAA